MGFAIDEVVNPSIPLKNPDFQRQLTMFHSSSEGIPANAYKIQLVLVTDCASSKFIWSDLERANMNFYVETRLGKSEYGKTYKGYVAPADSPDKCSLVAVKIFYKTTITGSNRNILILCNSLEISSLGRLQHPNLVKVLGCSAEKGEMLVVNEYMSSGSVADHLFNHDFQNMGYQQCHPFSWNLRLKVALQAAKGLAYLHSQTPSVIHGNLKPGNILLDQDFNAKLSDFGLFKDERPDKNIGFHYRVKLGYIAPEIMETANLTTRCDVFSLGAVLLVMLSGVRPNEKLHGKCLIDYEKDAHEWCNDKGIVMNMADNMGCPYDLNGALLLARLVSQCLYKESSRRLMMDEIVERLEYVYEHHQIAEE